MPETLKEPEYGEDFAVRRITGDGILKWRTRRVLVGRPLANQPVGLRDVDEDEWELFYGSLHIANVLLRAGALRVTPP